MGKKKRFAAIVIGLIILLGIALAFRPQGRTNMSPTHHTQSGSHDHIGAIGISFSINARGGPQKSYWYIEPDGRGFVYVQRRGRLDPFVAIDETFAKVEAGSEPLSFTFSSSGSYRQVRELVEPLRQISGKIRSGDQAGVAGKSIIDCEPPGYHAAYFIAWLPPQPMADFSYFDASSSYRDCTAMRSALDRLWEVRTVFKALRGVRAPAQIKT